MATFIEVEQIDGSKAAINVEDISSVVANESVCFICTKGNDSPFEVKLTYEEAKQALVNYGKSTFVDAKRPRGGARTKSYSYGADNS